MDLFNTLTKEQQSTWRRQHRLAWLHFYPEGKGRSKRGYALHHVNMELRYNDVDRYIQWNVDDLAMLTFKEHNLVHKKHELMRAASDEAHRGSHHYYNTETGERRMFKEKPEGPWEQCLYYEAGVYVQIGENNGSYMKNIYENKSEEELTEIKEKKLNTFYSKSQEERDIINGRRGKGSPVVCITTGEYFKNSHTAMLEYKKYGCSKIFKVYQGECYAGLKDGVRLRWRLATKEEIEAHEEN